MDEEAYNFDEKVVSEVLQQTLDTVVVGVAACNWGIRTTTELEGKNQMGTASFEDSVTQKGVEHC